jgi:hypothetical protein
LRLRFTINSSILMDTGSLPKPHPYGTSVVGSTGIDCGWADLRCEPQARTFSVG